MSLRISTVFWMVIIACSFLGLYMVKYKVQAIKAEVAAAERQLKEEKRNLHVAEAEWSYLNRPERLAQLSAKYLALTPLAGRQLASYNSLPVGNTALVMREAVAKVAQKKQTGRNVALAGGVGHER